jgi:15-cis-phytoene synthase
MKDIVREGQVLLADARRRAVPRSAVAAMLPAVLARRDLRHWPSVAVPRRLADRLAVVFVGLTGRV